jgi:hypothetical protein
VTLLALAATALALALSTACLLALRALAGGAVPGLRTRGGRRRVASIGPGRRLALPRGRR